MFNQSRIIPLAQLKAGQKGRVVLAGVYGGRGFSQHLYDMGIVEGSDIEVVTPGRPGPFLVNINNTSLAIGQGVANKIMIEERR
jgi:ferrous iron transport protein A